MSRNLSRCLLLLAAFVIQAAVGTPAAHAQIGGGAAGGGGIGGNQNAGIEVDATGVLRRMSVDPTGDLTRQRLQSAKRLLGADVKKWSPLRFVSLHRLENSVRALRAAGRPVEPMQMTLAGLTRLQYVFYLPDTKDVVIAGPAEPYYMDGEGEIRGVHSHRPVLQLPDLVVALRAFPPSGEATPLVGCSIDPTPEGNQRMQQFLKSIGTNLSANANTARIAQGLRSSLGMQVVRVDGVSPKSRFAHILVSADYRMKLIGIGLEKPAVDISSFVDLARGGQGPSRWYFTPNYETVRVSEDRLAMELVGEGVKLSGEDELLNPDGTRRGTGKSSGANRKFVEGFTRRYPDLAKKEPVYAHLRNLIDMTIAAAYIQQQDFYSQAGWNMETFGLEQKFPVEVFNAPTQVEPAINVVLKGSTVYMPIGGGVDIQARRALDSPNLLPDEGERLNDLRSGISVHELKESDWFWDAEGLIDAK